MKFAMVMAALLQFQCSSSVFVVPTSKANVHAGLSVSGLPSFWKRAAENEPLRALQNTQLQ